MSAARCAALFVRADSIYKQIDGVDCWDIERDARKWPGGLPVVAHPPCRAWGQLRHFAKPRADEKELAFFAVDMVRTYGGVLEHPAKSTLWPAANLPEPGGVDKFGGWTLPVDQNWWGHRAKKATRLYVVGCEFKDIPRMPIVLGEATHVVGLWSGRDRARARKSIGTAEREKTPVDLARWLVELASRCAA